MRSEDEVLQGPSKFQIRLAHIFQDLYPYPFDTLQKNIIRCFAFLSSWICSILFLRPFSSSNSPSEGILAAATFLYFISLLLEFTSLPRTYAPGKVIYGIFNGIAYSGVVISLIVIIINLTSLKTDTEPITERLSFFGIVLFVLSAIEAGVLFLGSLACIIKIDRFFFNEDSIREEANLVEQDERVKSFYSKLNGEEE